MPTDRHRIHVTPGLEGTNTVRRDPVRRVLLEQLAEGGRLTPAGEDVLKLGPPLTAAADTPLPGDTLGDLRSDER